jgi:predicted nucleic acid-binding Zn ribbon protein
MEKVCEYCGKTYTPYKNSQKYCSRQCSSAALLEMTRTCVVCGEKFQCLGKYCSDKCHKTHERFKHVFREKIEKYGVSIIRFGRDNPFSNAQAVWRAWKEEHREFFDE